MTLSRTDISDGLVNELNSFEQLVLSLSQAELDSPSRCEGWTVGDVARHTIGGMADVAAGRLDGLGSPEVTAREVAERAGRTAGELADECAQVAQAAAALLSIFDDTTWEAPAGGGYGDDIRNALGRPTELDTGLHAALSHIEYSLGQLGWTGDMPGLDDPNALTFILAATGRTDGASFGANAPINLYA